MPRSIPTTPSSRTTLCAMGLTAAVFLASVSGMLLPHVASAQGAYPARPIRVIVPFPPGNASDLAARTIAEPLAARLRQPVVIDNRGGAAGTIGSEAARRRRPMATR